LFVVSPTTPSSPKRWIIGISGASGTIYARALVRALLEEVPEMELDVVISEGAFRVLREEEGLKVSANRPSASELFGSESKRLRFHNCGDTGAVIASGSYLTEGMVVIPCSVATLSAIATGYSDNLLRRAADVTLKEGRKLILVPRETPLSQSHLECMLSLSRRSVSIVPAMPGFYQRPKNIKELVDAFIMRVADQMGFSLSLTKRWRSST
jgi:flavin prenyltransferase